MRRLRHSGGAAGAEHIQGQLALLGALVYGFNGLKREFESRRGGAVAVGVVFAVPDEFYHRGSSPLLRKAGIQFNFSTEWGRGRVGWGVCVEWPSFITLDWFVL